MSTHSNDRRVKLSSIITPRAYVRINVSGMIYETFNTTLERFPSTLLGNEESRQQYFEESTNAYYFDRNRKSFEAILYYYQSNGLLIRPRDVPMPMFLDEISFFRLGEDVLMELQVNDGYISKDVFDLPDRYWQRQIWELFEYPNSSVAAKVLACWCIFVVTASVVTFCIETMPSLNTERNEDSQPWFSLGFGYIVWFTIEYILRLVSSPNKWKFLTSLLNTIDLLAILPYFISLSIDGINTTAFSVLRIVRLVRVFRIFKLSRHSQGLRVLGQTLKASISELALLALFLTIGVILFSSAVYYAEHEDNDMFLGISDAFWYSIITMTTVGYGDKWPLTGLGKLIGAVCALSGILAIAFTLPVIVFNFEFYYKREKMVA